MIYLNYSAWKCERYTYSPGWIPSREELLRDGIHSFTISELMPELTLDLLASGVNQYVSDSVLIGFNGALSAKTIAKGGMPPYFSGVGLARLVEMPIFCIADPTMALDPGLTMAWYAGNKFIPNLNYEIAKILDMLVSTIGLNPILLGGSAGGYAALNIGHLMKSSGVSVLCWNPQTSLDEYQINLVQKYLNVAYGGRDTTPAHFEERTVFKSTLRKHYHDVPYTLPSLDIFNKESKIIYLQNRSDISHLAPHAGKWLNDSKFRRVSPSAFVNEGGNVLFFIGCWGNGHISPPLSAVVDLINCLHRKKSLSDIARTRLQDSDMGGQSNFPWLRSESIFLHDIKWSTRLDSTKRLRVQITPGAKLGTVGDFEYAFYLRKGRDVLARRLYSSDAVAYFNITGLDQKKMAVSIFLRDRLGGIKSFSIPVAGA